MLAVKEACDLPVIAQMTFQRDGRTMGGEPPDEVANVAAHARRRRRGRQLQPRPAVRAGRHRPMAAQTVDAPLGDAERRPSALHRSPPGLPLDAGVLRRVRAASSSQAGANIVGGCCGTTPEHISAMREALGQEWNTRGRAAARVASRTSRDTGRRGHLTGVARNGNEQPRRTLREKLATGEFVVSVELDPPRGLNPRKALEGAAHLKALGADCINIGDSPMARVRMSADRARRPDRAATSASSRSSTSRRATGT